MMDYRIVEKKDLGHIWHNEKSSYYFEGGT